MTGKQRLAKLEDKKQPQIIVSDGADSGQAVVWGKQYDSMPVVLLRFPPTLPQDLNGKNGCSSVTSNREGIMPRSMHTIDFIPALNQFRVIFHGNDGPKTDMVPIHRVNAWTPFEDGQTYLIPGKR